MRKILLTTTALVATAGYAAAEVAVTGSAELGFDKGGEDKTLTFHQDIDVTFALSTETDGGLGISASIDLDEATKLDTGPYDDQGFAIAISSGFGTVTLGDTDGALDWAITEGHSVTPGSIADNHTSFDGGIYKASGLDGEYDGQVLRYDNDFGVASVAFSVERVDSTKTKATNTPAATTTAGDAIGKGTGFGLGVKVPAGPVTVGVGYQTAEKQIVGEADTASDTAATAILSRKYNLTAVSVNGEFSGIKGTLAFLRGDLGKYNGDADTATDNNQSAFEKASLNQTQLGLGYDLDGVSFGAHTFTGKADGEKQNGTGFSVSYDLGGGVKAQFGASNEKSYSLGLSMSF